MVSHHNQTFTSSIVCHLSLQRQFYLKEPAEIKWNILVLFSKNIEPLFQIFKRTKHSRESVVTSSFLTWDLCEYTAPSFDQTSSHTHSAGRSLIPFLIHSCSAHGTVQGRMSWKASVTGWRETAARTNPALSISSTQLWFPVELNDVTVWVSHRVCFQEKTCNLLVYQGFNWIYLYSS